MNSRFLIEAEANECHGLLSDVSPRLLLLEHENVPSFSYRESTLPNVPSRGSDLSEFVILKGFEVEKRIHRIMQVHQLCIKASGVSHCTFDMAHRPRLRFGQGSFSDSVNQIGT